MPGFNMDDYVPVNERIAAFLAKHPDGSLQCDIIEMTEDRVTVKAYAYRTADDPRPGTGLASEPIPGRTSFTQGSEVENAETSAWGRAIAALGFEVKRGIASREEMRRQQPQSGERAPAAGRRAAKPATTRSAAQRTPEEEALRDEILALPGMTHTRMELLAKAANVKDGRASADQLREMLRIANEPLPTPGPASAHADAPAPTSQVAGSAATAATPAVASDPPQEQPSAAPTMEDVLTVTGGEEVPPRPGSPEYRALPNGRERAKATQWWAEHKNEQESLAAALGNPVADA